jgi:hypothetical protein
LDTSKQVHINILIDSYQKMSRSLTGKTALISVLHYLYKMNRDPITGIINPFKRMFVNETQLLGVAKEMNPEFHPSHFKFWADQGFLLLRGTREYSYLMVAVLMNIFSVGDQHISLVESVALQHPFGNLATLFESIFAEGIECNILKKQPLGIYTLQTLNLEDLSLDFIMGHVGIVYKIRPDHFGSGKNYILSHIRSHLLDRGVRNISILLVTSESRISIQLRARRRYLSFRECKCVKKMEIYPKDYFRSVVRI